jgi:hypothetical protein
VTELRAAVIDTSALFSALASHYDSFRQEYAKGKVPWISNLKRPLDSVAARTRYLEILGAIPEKLVTSHVIAECYGLRSRLDLNSKACTDFWRMSVDLLLQWNVEEQLVSLSELCKNPELKDFIPRIGPTDTALIALAMQRQCILVTEDERTLAWAATRFGVDCRLVEHLLPI